MAFLLVVLALLSSAALAGGNDTISAYADAKRLLYGTIYSDHRATLYCGAEFDADRNVTLPSGFIVAAHEDRARRAEPLLCPYALQTASLRPLFFAIIYHAAALCNRNTAPVVGRGGVVLLSFRRA